ncbi:unnamed protein product [Caenorhabditis auriculariae]|uniref:Uncharacterized protein n=1 Tax=Caenorhabditis auriculariae TaxID=2777116 RepID=A0A8S1GZR3_9PELO|nr:unnamed protein product [Caenorhabditis auriculariae]
MWIGDRFVDTTIFKSKMEAFGNIYPLCGIFIHCFELYLIVWKTPKFVQSKIPQAIRAVLAIPVDFMTQDSGMGFIFIQGLGDNWMNENLTVLSEESYTYKGRDQFVMRISLDHNFMMRGAHRSATGCVPVYGPKGHKFDLRHDPTKGFKKCSGKPRLHNPQPSHTRTDMSLEPVH